MDNLSGDAKWTLTDQPEEKEVVKVVKPELSEERKKRDLEFVKKVNELDITTLDKFEKDVREIYENHAQKNLGDLLIMLGSVRSSYNKVKEDLKFYNHGNTKQGDKVLLN